MVRGCATVLAVASLHMLLLPCAEAAGNTTCKKVLLVPASGSTAENILETEIPLLAIILAGWVSWRRSSRIRREVAYTATNTVAASASASRASGPIVRVLQPPLPHH